MQDNLNCESCHVTVQKSKDQPAIVPGHRLLQNTFETPQKVEDDEMHLDEIDLHQAGALPFKLNGVIPTSVVNGRK